MGAELLRPSSHLTRVTGKILRDLKANVNESCRNNHSAFFRIHSNVITFTYGNARYRLDVDISRDSGARQQMHLTASEGMYYAQLQTGRGIENGSTVANIVYPADSNKVQLNTLITALKDSMEHTAIYTAIG